MEIRKELANVHVSDEIIEYIVSIADMTRNHSQLRMGASPRAALGMYRAVKVWAAMNGRDYVIPDDVKELAQPVLGHRLILKNSSSLSGITTESILEEILEKVEATPDVSKVVE